MKDLSVIYVVQQAVTLTGALANKPVIWIDYRVGIISIVMCEVQ